MVDTGTTKTYTVAEINQLIKTAIERQRFDSYKLISAAGYAVYQTLRRHWPAARKMAIVCGPGDNGANGYVAATAAVQDPKVALDIILYAEKSPEFSDPIAQQVFAEAKAAGVKMQFGMPLLKDREVVIDAIFGNSLRQPIALSDPYYQFIERFNMQAAPILSVDVPSGLNADTGEIEGIAVQATRTLTFVGLKVGMTINQGPQYCGEISCFDANIH